ncbi:MAG: 1-phosphofructokinase family hexose kinase [Elusimicrobia bacterium]|nr:1-phosphofructokinase family hexose kinase [Elusimicrobiota bacterium]
MILVVSLNTALDKTLVLGRLRPGTRHRPERSLDLAGGKGVNAARVLRRLGLPARVLGFLAGDTGRHIAALLAREGVPADWVALPGGESRVCLTVHHGSGPPTEINEPGPAVTRLGLRRLEAVFLRRLASCRFVLLCGRVPPGVPAGCYGRLIRLAHAANVPCALDASEPALSRGLAARPDIVKPNAVEMAELGLAVRPARWAASLARLRELGGREVFVTMGRRGALMADDAGALFAAGPLARGFPLGAGDAFLAGAVYGRLKGWGRERRLAFATALASASVRSLGAGVFRREHLRRALGAVRVRRVNS